MASPDKIRIGIIGTGSIADDRHAPALNRLPNAVLWSVLSRDKEKATDFAGRHNAMAKNPAHNSLEEFLNDPDLDAVIIAIPDKLHAEYIITCAKAGKHILVEKPMVTSHAEGLDVIKACEDNNVKLGVAFHLRWHAGHRKLHELIVSQKTLGTLQHIRVHWTFQAPDATTWRARNDFGQWWSLAANGAHCFDLMHWFSGAENNDTSKMASLLQSPVWNSPHDESAHVLFEFSNGVSAQLTTSVLYNSPSRFEIYGSKGYAICEDTLCRFGTGEISINGEPFEYELQCPFEGEIDNFISSIKNNHPPEADGKRGLMIVDDMLKAVQQNLE